MASRVLANLLVACSGAVFRAASQAWSKALQNAKASGVHAEHHAKKNAYGKSSSKVSSSSSSSSSKTTTTGSVSLDEAKKILPMGPAETKEEMLAKFDRAFAKNENVSFYVQSKLFRAKETLGKEVFGMTEEEASADPRRRRRTSTTEEEEGQNHATTTNNNDVALPNKNDVNDAKTKPPPTEE